MRRQGRAYNYSHTDCYFLKGTTVSNAYKPMGSGQKYQAAGDESNRQKATDQKVD